MKLFTPKLEKRFAEVGSQRDQADPFVIAKFYSSAGEAYWYITECNANGDIFYGYTKGLLINEWNYFSPEIFEHIELGVGIAIERDEGFKEMPISEVVPDLKPSIQEIKLEQIRDQVEENRGKDLGNEH